MWVKGMWEFFYYFLHFFFKSELCQNTRKSKNDENSNWTNSSGARERAIHKEYVGGKLDKI